MRKKILIGIVYLIFILLLASALILSAQILKLKKQNSLLNEQLVSRKCFPPLREMSFSRNSSLGDKLIFSSAQNFKKGLSDDLPADFVFYPGSELERVYSFPDPYLSTFGVKKGVIFSSADEAQKISDYYVKTLSDRSWVLYSSDTGDDYKRLVFLKGEKFLSFKIYDSVSDILPEGLDLAGPRLVILRYE